MTNHLSSHRYYRLAAEIPGDSLEIRCMGRSGGVTRTVSTSWRTDRRGRPERSGGRARAGSAHRWWTEAPPNTWRSSEATPQGEAATGRRSRPVSPDHYGRPPLAPGRRLTTARPGRRHRHDGPLPAARPARPPRRCPLRHRSRSPRSHLSAASTANSRTAPPSPHTPARTTNTSPHPSALSPRPAARTMTLPG